MSAATSIAVSVPSHVAPEAGFEPLVEGRFVLLAEASPCLLPRLLQPFARRGLAPDLLSARRLDTLMEVEIALHAMPREMVHLVDGNLRQVVGVHRLMTTHSAAEAD